MDHPKDNSLFGLGLQGKYLSKQQCIRTTLVQVCLVCPVSPGEPVDEDLKWWSYWHVFPHNFILKRNAFSCFNYENKYIYIYMYHMLYLDSQQLK